MAENDPRDSRENTRLMSAMMDLDTSPPIAWQTEELASILAHQLKAPLNVDLQTVDPDIGTRLAALSGASSHPIETFADLLTHPEPPLELMELVKNFAKSNMNTSAAVLPREIATVLYFSSILLAQVRCRRSISRLDDAAIRNGVTWVTNQPWLEPTLRSTLQQALAGR